MKDERPSRGTPEATRARLVAAAARVINRDGYTGTDTNAIAREAGYSPGTFYKHFTDKRAILLAAYEEWVAGEWRTIGELVEKERASPPRLAHALVAAVIDHHRRWRGLRASLRALTLADAEVRSFYLAQRRGQLDLLDAMRARGRSRARSREDGALLLYTMERTCDALADDEAPALGLDERRLVALLEAAIVAFVAP